MVPDRFDGLPKSRFEIGGFAVCVVSALGIYINNQSQVEINW